MSRSSLTECFPLLSGGVRQETRQDQSARVCFLRVEELEERVVMSASPASILSQDVIVYDVTTTGSLSFNLRTGQYSAEVELPAGLSLDTAALKTLLSGQFAIPDIDPIEATGALGGLRTEETTNYNQVRSGLIRQYGGGNVYFSTQRFTDWASPENLAATVAAAVATGGATTGQIIQEAREVILGELGNLYSWLMSRAPARAEAVLSAALKGMVTGRRVETPLVSIRFVNVHQTYTVGLGGAAAVIAEGLGVGSPQTIDVTHKGFVVIWKGGNSDASLARALNKFDGASLSGMTAFRDMIGRLAGRTNLRALGEVAQAVLDADQSAVVDHAVANQLSGVLNLSPTQLRSLYRTGNPIINLRGTQLDEQLAGLIGELAAGNEGSTRVTKLEFNLNTYEVTAEVSVRHRHSWGNLGEWVDYLRSVLDKSYAEIAGILSEAGAELSEIAGALWDETAAGVADIAGALWDGIGGLDYSDVARALWDGIEEAGLPEIAGALWDGIQESGLDDVADALWNMGIGGFHFSDIAGALWDGTDAGLPAIAGALWDGIQESGLDDVAGALWDGIDGLGFSDIAGALWDGVDGIDLSEVAGALWDGIQETTFGDVAGALWGGIGGLDFSDVARALWDGIEESGLDDIAGALWDGIDGIYLSDVAGALWNMGIGGFTAGNIAYALWHGCSDITISNVIGALQVGLDLDYWDAWSIANSL